MAANWKTVRVFISSTFRDMHAERDHLVRVVFPELKERCRTRHVHLIDVDLRWGVTEADAEDGKALDICLDEIDGCRPYFLGILGHRYGFVPEGHRHSITAQEIHHGVLHGSVPTQVVDLRTILDEPLEGHTLSREQKDCLVRCYTWDADKRKYLLQDDVAPEDAAIIRAVFARYSNYQRDRSFFFFRSEALSRQLAGPRPSDFFEPDPKDREKLDSLKREIADAGLPHVEYGDIETFGQLVLNTLWQRITAETLSLPVADLDWLEQEAELHGLFMADRTRRFVGRRDLLDRMHGFCDREEPPSVLVVTGTPGCGKSALMARFTDEATRRHPDWLVLGHFVGASPASTSLRQLLRRVCTQIKRATGATDDAPEDIRALLTLFPELLSQASEQRPLLIVIDAVNQLEQSDQAHAMRWLPQILRPHVRVVISTLAGDVLDAMRQRRVAPLEESVAGLTAAETREVVGGYLKEIRHEFPNREAEAAFHRKVARGNPLYILTALEELRLFGTFEELGRRIDELPDSVPALFDQVLERIEGDFPPAVVRDCMVYIACGRHGMTAEELQALLKAHAPRLEPDSVPLKYPDMLWARLRRAFGTHLVEHSSVIVFFHEQLARAVEARYLAATEARESAHRAIADHMAERWRKPYRRALEELPYQYMQAHQWDALVRLLTDLEFIEDKHAAGLAGDLLEDYSRSLRQEALPAEAQGSLHEFFAFVRAQSAVLAERPSLTFQQAVNEPEHSAPALAARATLATGMAPQNWLKRLNGPRSTACSMTIVHDRTVSACAFSPDGSMIAAGSWDGELRVWNATTGKALKSVYVDCVVSCAFSHDGQLILVGSLDGTLTLWDVASGSTLAAARWPLPSGDQAVPELGWLDAFVPLTLSHPNVTTFFGPHNRLARVCEGFDRITLGESDPLHELAEVRGTGDFETLADLRWAFSPEGDRFVNGGHEKYLQLFQLELLDLDKSGRGLVLDDYLDWVSMVCKGLNQFPCPDAIDLPEMTDEELQWFLRRATARGASNSALEDRDVLAQGLYARRLGVLVGHREAIRCCAFSPDGERIVSGSSDGTVRLWDGRASAGTWQQPGVREAIATYSGHSAGLVACAFSHDGRQLLSGDAAGTLKIWAADEVKRETGPFQAYVGDRSAIVHDRRAGECSVLSDHRAEIVRCLFSPDGGMIVSASGDSTLKVWEGETGLLLNTFGQTAGWERGTFAFHFTATGRRLIAAFLPWSIEDDTLPYVKGEVSLADHPPARQPGEWLLINLETGELADTIAARRLLPDGSEDCRSVDRVEPDAVATTPTIETSGNFLVLRHPGDLHILCEYRLGGRCTSWGWHPDGRRLVVGTEWGELHLLRLEGAAMMAAGEPAHTIDLHRT